MADPYETLGIAPCASAAEVKTAYRTLARKWHPDRFPEGTERIEAEQCMVRLNQAYEDALKCCASARPAAAASEADTRPPREQEELLSDVRSLMALGQLDRARRALLRSKGRGAEWNYLFGAILMRMGDYEKASVYFGISSRMSPESAQYRAALRSAQTLRDRNRKPIWQQCLAHLFSSIKKARPAAHTFAAK